VTRYFALKDSLVQLFRNAGLEHVALVDARQTFAPKNGRWRRHLEAYFSWLRRGRQGTMTYLDGGSPLRANPSMLLANLGASFVFLIPYETAGLKTAEPSKPVDGLKGPSELRLNIARYAQSKDYHRVIKRRLTQIFDGLMADGAGRYRVVVDSVPFFDRAHAEMAGLGFVGKNTLVIRPGVGSAFFIASVLTDADPEQFGWSIEPASSVQRLASWGCASCDLCVRACPTGALLGDYTMDASVCLSYLSIEHRGPVSANLVGAFAHSFFGCDICQTVCPYNLRPKAQTVWPEFLAEPQQLDGLMVEDIAIMTPEQYELWFGGLPLTRAKFAGLVRNALYMLMARQDFGSLRKALGVWQQRLVDDPKGPASKGIEPVILQLQSMLQASAGS
jgi:epoxyqueuosine reductase